MRTIDLNIEADSIAKDVVVKETSKSMKIKTLLGLFKYERRTEEITTTITELLANRNIVINPSIMKLGDIWQQTWEEKIYLSIKKEQIIESMNLQNLLSPSWNNDGWFDQIITKEYRNEKEVATKFVIPLLTRLGYSENDRYDGMTIEACHGSKPTLLETDFSLFNSENEKLNGQVLLIIEAKKEDCKTKTLVLDKAKKQVKSYAYWLGCYYGLVTDGRKIQVLDLFGPTIKGDNGSIKTGIKILFECTRTELKDRFIEFYNLISKEKLTKFYESKMS